MVEHTDFPVIASGGISALSDLESLKDYLGEQLFGVILGKALYDNLIDLKEAISLFQNG